MKRPPGPVLVLVAACVAIGALGAWITSGWKLVPPDPATQAVRIVAEGAIRSLYLDAFPPASYTDGPLPSADAQAIRERVTSDIERYFTPPLQARYEPMILNAVNQIGTGAWDSQGDLSIDWDRTTINGDQATITFREHRWLIRRAVLSAGPSRDPWRLEGAWDWHLTLLRQDGHWRVDVLDGQCVGGCP